MFKTITVLYVEDEESLREVVSNIADVLFKKLIIAVDGQEGLDIFTENKDEIDLIITDINMPKMNGIDMCQNIRDIDTKIPIIITTAHNDKDFLHKAISIGISGFVTKPMDMNVLISTIKKSVEPIVLQQKLDEEFRLHQEERVANAKFSAIGQLAAGITHEINTPLTYIKASFEIMGYDIEDLEESKIKTDMLKHVHRITDGLLRIENIVGSMKEMSQQSKMQKENSNIYSTIITSAILAYNKIKHISSIYINGDLFDLSMDKDKEVFNVDIQKQRVEQVWIIIINNAMDELMKMEDFNNRRLEVNISQNETEVKVVFRDNAGGIKEDMLESLFEPFKGSKESSGMGVGLSIAQKIIDEQGAKIKAYNEDGGAVFEVLFSKV